MIIRRYYPKGERPGKTYTAEYLEFLRKRGAPVEFIDNARTEFILNPEEQRKAWDRCLQMVLNDTRWVLDNLERLPEFKVGWQDYHSQEYKDKKRKRPKSF